MGGGPQVLRRHTLVSMRARDTHPCQHDVTPEGGRGVGKDVYRALGVVSRVASQGAGP
jgi:hypothetical protein